MHEHQLRFSFCFFVFGGVFLWLCGLFADDIGKRMHDKRFRFFYWAGSEMKL